ncbi:MAG: response regulator [Gammaproteobacteria bacterium]|nr:response regulator [Gammaproteobacteria bacterium]
MNGETILIVDDNEVNLRLAKALLVRAGFHVLTAGDAEQALSLLRGVQPRLILMDIQMPGMDGLTLTRLLKSAPATRDIVIVALTAYAMKGDDEKAYAAGCSGYLIKPIDADTFGDEVAAFFTPLPPPHPPGSQAPVLPA